MGKGSARRKEDTNKIISNWDAIFGKKEKKEEQNKNPEEKKEEKK